MLYLGPTGHDVIEQINLPQLKNIVNNFGLHTNYPASPLPIYREIGTKLARKNLPKNIPAYCGWHPKHKRTFAIFDSSLSGLELKHALWHELSHLLFDSIGPAYYLTREPKLQNKKSEMLCELRAAYLSVSFEAMMQMYQDGWTDDQVTGALKVPLHYLKLRHDIYVSKEIPEIFNYQIPFMELPGV